MAKLYTKAAFLSTRRHNLHAKVSKLAGKTVFISGASRGIGKAIALKCARDGANIIVAAKTAEPHPKLPGTIYTAAKEIEEAGGQCLPCVVDIRHEDQVVAAVEKAVKLFGGIDILVNNASAIQLTGTLDTSMKTFDLMNSVNSRGTYLCSKVCLPHLKLAANPHILNISPPLNMDAKWFKNHVAYTMAKYGMSQCALGMAEEFREDGVAVNTLWPRTAIYTAAMEMLGGGPSIKSQCRKPEIVSDAAYYILTQDSRQFTGNFCIDEDVLREAGVTDLDQYACDKDGKLMVDFFLDDFEGPSTVSGGGRNDEQTSAPGYSEEEIEKTFTAIQSMLNLDLVKSVDAVYHFDLRDGELWYLDLKNDGGSAGKGSAPAGEADSTLTLTGDDFVKMFAGKLSPTTAFMMGKLKIKGNMGLAMKLEKLMKKMSSRSKL